MYHSGDFNTNMHKLIQPYDQCEVLAFDTASPSDSSGSDHIMTLDVREREV